MKAWQLCCIQVKEDTEEQQQYPWHPGRRFRSAFDVPIKQHNAESLALRHRIQTHYLLFLAVRAAPSQCTIAMPSTDPRSGSAEKESDAGSFVATGGERGTSTDSVGEGNGRLLVGATAVSSGREDGGSRHQSGPPYRSADSPSSSPALTSGRKRGRESRDANADASQPAHRIVSPPAVATTVVSTAATIVSTAPTGKSSQQTTKRQKQADAAEDTVQQVVITNSGKLGCSVVIGLDEISIASLYVLSVSPGSLAAAAGLRKGDIVAHYGSSLDKVAYMSEVEFLGKASTPRSNGSPLKFAILRRPEGAARADAISEICHHPASTQPPSNQNPYPYYQYHPYPYSYPMHQTDEALVKRNSFLEKRNQFLEQDNSRMKHEITRMKLNRALGADAQLGNKCLALEVKRDELNAEMAKLQKEFNAMRDTLNAEMVKLQNNIVAERNLLRDEKDKTSALQWKEFKAKRDRLKVEIANLKNNIVAERNLLRDEKDKTSALQGWPALKAEGDTLKAEMTKIQMKLETKRDELNAEIVKLHKNIVAERSVLRDEKDKTSALQGWPAFKAERDASNAEIARLRSVLRDEKDKTRDAKAERDALNVEIANLRSVLRDEKDKMDLLQGWPALKAERDALNVEIANLKEDVEKQLSHPAYDSQGQIIRPVRYFTVPGRQNKYNWQKMILSQDFVQKMDGNSRKLGITSQDCARDCVAELADKLPATKAKLEHAIKSIGLDPDLHPLQLGASMGAAKPEDVKQAIVGNYFASSDLPNAFASDGSLSVVGITFLKQIEDAQAKLAKLLYGVPDEEYRVQFRAQTSLFDTHPLCYPTDASKNHDSKVNMRILLEKTEALQREIITNALNDMPNTNVLIAVGSIAAPTAHMVRAKCTRGKNMDVCPSYHCHYSASTERAGSQNRDGGIERERMEESAQSLATGVAAVLGKPLVKAPVDDPDFWYKNYLEVYPQTRNDTSVSSPKQHQWQTAAEAGENDPRLANWMVKKTNSNTLYRKDGLTLTRTKSLEHEEHGINGSTGSRSVCYWL